MPPRKGVAENAKGALLDEGVRRLTSKIEVLPRERKEAGTGVIIHLTPATGCVPHSITVG
jgi:hypothetical protein